MSTSNPFIYRPSNCIRVTGYSMHLPSCYNTGVFHHPGLYLQAHPYVSSPSRPATLIEVLAIIYVQWVYQSNWWGVIDDYLSQWRWSSRTVCISKTANACHRLPSGGSCFILVNFFLPITCHVKLLYPSIELFVGIGGHKPGFVRLGVKRTSHVGKQWPPGIIELRMLYLDHESVHYCLPSTQNVQGGGMFSSKRSSTRRRF